LLSVDGLARLRHYREHGADRPEPGFWSTKEIADAFGD